MSAFAKAVKSTKQSKIERIIENPRKIITSQVLKFIWQKFHKSGLIKTKTFFGENMFIVYPEFVSMFIYRDGYYEEGLTNMILRYLKPAMTFCDVGAHFGFFSLLASAIVGGKGRVYSFEPTPETYSVLLKNTKEKTNIITNNIALFSSKTILPFNNYGLRYSAYNSFSQARLDDNILKKVVPQRITVNTITLDEYTENNNIKLDFVKIDAESAEYEILKGMKKILSKRRPIVTIETGDFIKSSKICLSYIMNFDYQPYEFRDNKIVKHQIKDKYEYNNILFLPK